MSTPIHTSHFLRLAVRCSTLALALAAVTLPWGGCAAPSSTGTKATTRNATEALPPPAVAESPGPLAVPGLASPGASAYGPGGTWYLSENGARMRLVLDCPDLACSGYIIDESDARKDALDAVSWDEKSGKLVFAETGPGFRSWFHVSLVEGILVGRFSVSADRDDEPTNPADYAHHVTGWKAQYVDQWLSPRVFDLTIDGDSYAHLRIDRAPATHGRFEARYKVYASASLRAAAEEDEHDASVEQWDGENLAFTVRDPDWVRVCVTRVTGREIAGTCTQTDDGSLHDVTGVRAEVLSHGFSGKSLPARAAWQARVRSQLAHLLMADSPAPLGVTVTTLAGPFAPFAAGAPALDRDDGDPSQYPQDYSIREIQLDVQLPDPNGASAGFTRAIHGYLTLPDAPSPTGSYPTVIALNGHEGSAWDTLHADSAYYWYGDSFARRGYAVLAIDVGHRPLSDRNGLYPGVESGDDQAHKNGVHPAIETPGMDSDWEEAGERAWDVMRAVDYLRAQSFVDQSRILVVGHSLGGEVANYAAAMDPRIGLTVASGFSPDLGVLYFHGSHPCWQWRNADIREYIGTSDLETLVAPRPLVIETGIQDWTFSWMKQPFASDKQVLRRTRVDYRDAPGSLIHYLHGDVHHFHVGDGDVLGLDQPDVRTPVFTAPETPWSLDWQRDGATWATGASLFDFIDRLLPPLPPAKIGPHL